MSTDESEFDWRNCRPQITSIGCPPEHQEVFTWFYWIMFTLHAISATCIIGLAFYYFPATTWCGREPKSRKLLKVYYLLCLLQSALDFAYSLIRTRSDQFGVPPAISIMMFSAAHNIALISATFTTFVWAEALNNKSLRTPKGILEKYRLHFCAFVLYRIITQMLFAIITALNVNDSYYIVIRIWLLEWSVALIAAFIFVERVTSKLLLLMDEYGARDESRKKLRRYRILILVTGANAAVLTTVHAVIIHYLDRIPALYIIIIGAYHIAGTVGTVWFMTVKPARMEPEQTTSKISQSGSV